MERVIEVFENERYQPASGWSSGGLMITDRNTFSTENGRVGWKTLDSAASDLISFGWEWKSAEWDVDSNFHNTDVDGWSYCTNFGNFDNGSCETKGMLHFVRRRRYIRVQNLRNENGNNGDADKMLCNACDMEEMQRLASVMLQALAASSLQAGITTLADPNVNQLKNKMMDVVLSHGATSCYPEGLVFALQKFVGSSHSGWMQSCAMDNLVPRLRELDGPHYFPTEERLHLAQMVIRSLDHNGDYHCMKLQSECSGGLRDSCDAAPPVPPIEHAHTAAIGDRDGTDTSMRHGTEADGTANGEGGDATNPNRCDFCVVTCPNIECLATFSHKHRLRHDLACEYKWVACHRECGELVSRRAMATHLDTACRLRPAKCVFVDLGCTTELRHCDVEVHMETCILSHLMLAVNRLAEQQKVIVDMHGKVRCLESRVGTHATSIVQTQQANAAAELALVTHKRLINDTLQDALQSLELKVNKKIHHLTTEVQTDSNAMKRVMQQQGGILHIIQTTSSHLTHAQQEKATDNSIN